MGCRPNHGGRSKHVACPRNRVSSRRSDGSGPFEACRTKEQNLLDDEGDVRFGSASKIPRKDSRPCIQIFLSKLPYG